MTWIVTLGLVGLVALTVVSALNVSLRTPTRTRVLEEFARRGQPRAYDRFLTRRDQYLLTTAALRSATVLIVFVSVLYLAHAADPGGGFKPIALGCFVAWSLLLVFGVAIPYAWAEYVGAGLVVRMVPLLDVLRIVGFPFLFVLAGFDPVVRRLVGAPARETRSVADEMELEILSAVSEGELHGAVDEQEKEMIESVIELGDKQVVEIMTPRTEVVALPVGADRQAVLDAVRAQGHSRIPVYEGSIDTILGVLYVKDLLGRIDDEKLDLRTVMRKALFVPESKPVRDLLREFQREKVHIAIVLDEYGGTAGLATVEDIVEEVVGDIADEHEPAEPPTLQRIDERTYEVDARMRINDLNDQLGVEFPSDRDYETIGGFVFSTLGKIPKAGEHCDFANVAIEVLSAELRRVTRLRLTVPPRDDADRAESASLDPVA